MHTDSIDELELLRSNLLWANESWSPYSYVGTHHVTSFYRVATTDFATFNQEKQRVEDGINYGNSLITANFNPQSSKVFWKKKNMSKRWSQVPNRKGRLTKPLNIIRNTHAYLKKSSMRVINNSTSLIKSQLIQRYNIYDIQNLWISLLWKRFLSHFWFNVDSTISAIIFVLRY